MEDQKFSFSGTFEKAKEYIETRVELLKLRMIAQSSKVIGAIILDVSKIILVLFIVFFLSLALGFYFGELFESYSLGFLTTGGIFLLILLLIRAFEVKLEKIFMNISVTRFLSKLNDEEEEKPDMAATSTIADEPLTPENEEQGIYNEELKRDENK